MKTALLLIILVVLSIMLGFICGFTAGQGSMRTEANVKIVQALKLGKI